MAEDKKEKRSNKKLLIVSLTVGILLVSGSLFIENTRKSLCRLTDGKLCLLLPAIRDLGGQEYIEIQKKSSDNYGWSQEKINRVKQEGF